MPRHFSIVTALLISAALLGGCSTGQGVGALGADDGAASTLAAPNVEQLAAQARAAKAKAPAAAEPKLVTRLSAQGPAAVSKPDAMSAARALIRAGDERTPRVTRRIEEPAAERLPNEALPSVAARPSEPAEERPALASAAAPSPDNAGVLRAIERLRAQQLGAGPAQAPDGETTGSIPRRSPGAPAHVQFALGETSLAETGRRAVDAFAAALPRDVRVVEVVGGLAGDGDAYTRLARANGRTQAVAARLPPGLSVETRYEAGLSNDTVRLLSGRRS